MPSPTLRQRRVQSTSAWALLVLPAILFALSGSWAAATPAAQPSERAERAELTAPTQSPHPATPTRAVEQAKALLDARQEDAAINLLKKFLEANPRSEDLDDAYLLLGAALNARKDYAEAAAALEALLTEFPGSELAPRARVQLGLALAGSERYDEALAVLAEARTATTDPALLREILKTVGDVQLKKGEPLRAIQAWKEEAQGAPPEAEPAIRDRIRTLVQQMDKKTLGQVRDAYPSEYPGDLALIRLIELHQAQGDDFFTERQIRLFLNRFPSHPYAATAADLLRSFKARAKASQHVLLAVLPLSGRLAPYGMEALNGIRIALDRAKDVPGMPSIGLVVKDSEGDRASLRAELADLLAEYRPLAVIGPLLSRELAAVAGLAEQAEVPFITPGATLSDVRRYGTYLFSTAVTFSLQADRMAAYAMTALGYRRFCVLYPESAYGQELARLFSQEVRQRGGEIIAMESYKETDTDFGPQIRRIKEADLRKYGTAETTTTSKGLPRVLYQPGFDAVFAPGDARQIALIAPQLQFYDIKVPLLGSVGWNTPDFLRIADRSVEGSLFVDGFFLDSPSPPIREFVDRYRQRYRANPTLFSAQAYDAARLVLEAIQRGATSGRAIRDSFMRDELPTLTGPARFGPDGALHRRLFVIQVRQGRFVQAD